MIGDDVRTYVLASATTFPALNNQTISQTVGTRYYPLILPQPKGDLAARFPAIAYYTVSPNTVYTQEGANNLTNAIVKVICHALTYDTSNNLAASMVSLLSGFKGQLNTYYVKGIFVQNQAQEFVDGLVYGIETGWYLNAFDLNLWYIL